jgi:hypothetical protein
MTQIAAGAAKVKGRSAPAHRRRVLSGYLYVAPLLLWLAGAILDPLLSGIWLCLQNI